MKKDKHEMKYHDNATQAQHKHEEGRIHQLGRQRKWKGKRKRKKKKKHQLVLDC
jgi:hypothetical protein